MAGVSDALDGWIARHFRWQTELGAYLDPAADKALLVSIFVTLGTRGYLPAWLVIAAVSRDVLILGAVMISWLMGQPVEVRPLFVSKMNTLGQITLAVAGACRIRRRAGPAPDHRGHGLDRRGLDDGLGGRLSRHMAAPYGAL